MPLTAVARPLPVLVPLIHAALQDAEAVRLERYREAGALLHEAKELVPHGAWQAWVRKRFKLSLRTAQLYMQISEKRNALRFSTLREARKALMVPEVAAAVDPAELARLREVACQLVDTGYKALARIYHPDRGGANADMARVNRARTALLTRARAWSGHP